MLTLRNLAFIGLVLAITPRGAVAGEPSASYQWWTAALVPNDSQSLGSDSFVAETARYEIIHVLVTSILAQFDPEDLLPLLFGGEGTGIWGDPHVELRSGATLPSVLPLLQILFDWDPYNAVLALAHSIS